MTGSGLFALCMAVGVIGILISSLAVRRSDLPEARLRRFRQWRQHTIGLLIGGAVVYWGTEWLPWMAALDIPVRIAGTVLVIYYTIQPLRAYRRSRAVLSSER